jgi:hypothetical protein
MIFVIPIILGAVALITAGVGIASGVDGVSKMEEAKKIGNAAQQRYQQKRKLVEGALKVTQDLAAEYGQLQVHVQLRTIKRFIAFIEKNGQRASSKDTEFFEGFVGVSFQQIHEYKNATLEAENLAAHGLAATGTAYAAGQSTIALIGLFGTASTGTAIGGLSGVAAWNATLAWLGGGSLAVGGGGMALGTLVLGGIALGPALMIGGFALGGQGEKALTDARQYEAEVNTEIAKLEVFEDFLGQVQRRMAELTSLLNTLNDRAIDGLIELESQPFDLERDAAKFQQVALLIKALAEIMKTPVLDAAGNLNQTTAKLQTLYNNI